MHYYYFNLNGGITSMPEHMAKQLMEALAPEWKTQKTEYGTLYYGEYDWHGEVVDGEYQTFPPRLKNGSIVSTNKIANDFFKQKIVGGCFLLPLDDKRGEVLAFVRKPHVRYEAV